MAMKKKAGARSTMTKKMAGKRGKISTAKRSGSSKTMKAARLAGMNAAAGGYFGGGKGE